VVVEEVLVDLVVLVLVLFEVVVEELVVVVGSAAAFTATAHIDQGFVFKSDQLIVTAPGVAFGSVLVANE